MKLIEQSHEIISIPEDLLQTIEIAARTCYKSEDKINKCTLNEDDDCELFPGLIYEICKHTECKYHSTQKFIQTLIKSGHHAMIEFGDIIVKCITNRGVTHEIVRHRLCSFAQESTRYVKYGESMEFILPVWFDKATGEQKRSFRNACNYAQGFYSDLLVEGWKPQQAREVLPNALKTEIVIKANIREWRHMFQLRTSKAAHPQIRALFIDILNDFKVQVPVVFDDIKL